MQLNEACYPFIPISLIPLINSEIHEDEKWDFNVKLLRDAGFAGSIVLMRTYKDLWQSKYKRSHVSYELLLSTQTQFKMTWITFRLSDVHIFLIYFCYVNFVSPNFLVFRWCVFFYLRNDGVFFIWERNKLMYFIRNQSFNTTWYILSKKKIQCGTSIEYEDCLRMRPLVQEYEFVCLRLNSTLEFSRYVWQHRLHSSIMVPNSETSSLPLL